jgi:hypothetical protein
MSVLLPARAPCGVFAGAVWLTREGGGVVNVRFVIVCDAAERGGLPCWKTGTHRCRDPEGVTKTQ